MGRWYKALNKEEFTKLVEKAYQGIPEKFKQKMENI